MIQRLMFSVKCRLQMAWKWHHTHSCKVHIYIQIANSPLRLVLTVCHTGIKSREKTVKPGPWNAKKKKGRRDINNKEDNCGSIRVHAEEAGSSDIQTLKRPNVKLRPVSFHFHSFTRWVCLPSRGTPSDFTGTSDVSRFFPKSEELSKPSWGFN